MNPISTDIALKFCDLCNWSYEAWVTHKKLFDENIHAETTIGKAKYFTSRLSVITQEYCLQQISKLHDPAIQKNSVNLTIEYMVRFGGWGADQDIVVDLQGRLSVLWGHLKPSRNKILSHNDLEALITNSVHGTFPAGLDDQYFETLQCLVNRVHERWVGGPHPFNALAGADVDEFLSLLERA